MRMKSAVPLFVIATSGCVATFASIPVAEPDRVMAEEALLQGEGIVRGSALLRQQGGGVVTYAGNEVFLVPATESAISGVRQVFGGDQGYVRRGGSTTLGGGTVVVPPVPNRQVVCDAQGFFRFQEVRPGRWYIMTSIVWSVGENYQGGALVDWVELADGEEVEIVLSQ